MPKEITVYRGWIGGRESDRQALEQLGVEVGPHSQETQCFDYCRIHGDRLSTLIMRWGHYTRGLIGQKETVYTQEELGGDDVPF